MHHLGAPACVEGNIDGMCSLMAIVAVGRLATINLPDAQLHDAV